MKHKKNKPAESAFVNDGYERALTAHAPEIQAALDAERVLLQQQFADQLATAGLFKRFWLRRRIARLLRAQRRELRDKFAPPGGMYLAQH